MLKQKEKVLEIYSSSTTLLYLLLERITEEQLKWKPAPDSRSIKEMFGHLVRVDNSFLKKLSIIPQVDDPGNKSAGEILSTLKKQHKQFEEFINTSDMNSISAKLILHAAQHYLYHHSQMVYLRRALDRSWQSPVDKWEALTYRIAELLLDLNKS